MSWGLLLGVASGLVFVYARDQWERYHGPGIRPWTPLAGDRLWPALDTGASSRD